MTEDEILLRNWKNLFRSHLHSDHFDPLAQKLLSWELPIFCQPGDETSIAAYGFQKYDANCTTGGQDGEMLVFR